jgi:Cytochrome c7 and related cytochrome c
MAPRAAHSELGMSLLYPSWANTVYRVAIGAILLAGASAIVLPMLLVRTPYNTEQFVPRDQPVAFDHRHHVRDDGIDCLYCHRNAPTGAVAGLPATDVCMGCHAQVWPRSPSLAPVRRSAESGTPLAWKRVHNLPDFVYFHHGVHVTAGIPCERCHGDVGRMASVVQVAPLTMGWCLDCHRDPGARIGERLGATSSFGATVQLFRPGRSRSYSITALTTCTACHR